VTPSSDRPPVERPTDRREFLGQVAASAIVIAGTACASPATAGQAPSPTPVPGAGAQSASSPPAHWDDSWFAKLDVKHKAVFDSPEIEDGLGVFQTTLYIRGMREALAAGPDDARVVLVIRHRAIPMAVNDAMWAKYGIGKEKKVKDEATSDWATKNPFLGPPSPSTPSSGSGARPGAADRVLPTLSWLAGHGHVLLGCDLAMRRLAADMAQSAKADRTAVYEEFKANLVPGLILQPSGIYAVHRAQEAGCTFLRST
jgi:hypothetical protein